MLEGPAGFGGPFVRTSILVTEPPCGVILGAMQEIFQIGLIVWVVVGVIVGATALIALARAPYRK